MSYRAICVSYPEVTRTRCRGRSQKIRVLMANQYFAQYIWIVLFFLIFQIFNVENHKKSLHRVIGGSSAKFKMKITRLFNPSSIRMGLRVVVFYTIYYSALF